MRFKKTKKIVRKTLFVDYIEFTLIRSDRKTVTLEVTSELEILVRAPYNFSDEDAKRIVTKDKKWIEKALARVRKRLELLPKEPTEIEKRKLFEIAADVIPQKVKKYSELMGVIPCGIKITSAKSRFGSCSPKNSLCFSYRLLMYPDEAIDYVVVHELAHIKHKNHSNRFYDEISNILPDYKNRIKLLKNIEKVAKD